MLDSGSQIMCPHGGTAVIVPKVTKISLGLGAPLVADDTITITGCAFNVSGAPSPCIRITWTMPSIRVQAEGTPVLLSTSVGLCVNAGGAPQGPAVVSGYQTKVQAQ